MWLEDFRARPAMKDVVVRLEACTFVGCEAINNEEEGSALSSSLAGDKDENADQTKTEDVNALRAEITALRAEKKLDRHEIAELKAAMLAGTSMEYDDDVGILGGMFICTSKL